jgi:hypothetical protein
MSALAILSRHAARRESRQLRVYVLGVVLHALSLNPAVNTAVAINDVVFDDLSACRSRK